MSKNDVFIAYLILLFVSKNILVRIFSLILIVVSLIKKEFVKENRKSILINLCYSVSIVFLNAFLNIDLLVVNLLYFVIVSYVFYKLKIGKDAYYIGYLIVVLAMGVKVLWLGL